MFSYPVVFGTRVITMTYGPGSSPALHTGAGTYCYDPSLSAEFIPSTAARPPVRFLLTVVEVQAFAFGQVFVSYEQREFVEFPFAKPDPLPTRYELQYETEESHDPLHTIADAIQGLRETAEQVTDSTPILEAVNVLDDEYAEAGKTLVREFGTPLSETHGDIVDCNVLG